MRPSWYTRAAVMATVMTVAIVTWAAATVAAPKDSHTPAARLSHWTLNSSEIFGPSDWTLIGGKRWAVTEDRHRLVEIIGAPGKQLSYGATQPIHGIPAGWDIEALTALSDDMLLAGTERDGARDEDYIFTLVRQAKGFAATRESPCPTATGEFGLATTRASKVCVSPIRTSLQPAKRLLSATGNASHHSFA